MIIRIYTRRTNLSNNWLCRTKHQITLPDKQKHFQKMQGMHQSKLQARHFLFKFNFFMRFSMILNSNKYQCFENNANEIYYNHQGTNIHNTSSASPCFPSVFCKFLLDSVLFPHWNLKPKKLLLITQALIKGHVNFQGF